eukprot:PhM_4_TR2515/c0_g1_i1/m.95423
MKQHTKISIISVCLLALLLLLVTAAQGVRAQQPKQHAGTSKEPTVVGSYHGTKTSLDAALERDGFALDGQGVVKILLLGNPGVGKSLMGNALMGIDGFHHHIPHYTKEGTPRSTTERQYGLIVPPVSADSKRPREAVVVYNLPGLLQDDEAEVETTRSEIEAALDEFPKARTAFVFVLNVTELKGIRPLDLEAMFAVHSYLPEAFDAMTVIMNGATIEEATIRHAFKMEGFEAAMTTALHQLAPTSNLHTTFAYHVHHNNRRQIASSQMQHLRSKMFPLLVGLVRVARPGITSASAKKGQSLALRRESADLQTHMAALRKRGDEIVSGLYERTNQWQRVIHETEKGRESVKLVPGHAGFFSRLTEALSSFQTKVLPRRGVPHTVFDSTENVEL